MPALPGRPRRSIYLGAALAVAVVIAAPAARAQPATGVADLSRPLVLARGEVLARLTLEASLAAGAVLEPVSLAPDLWVGVTHRLAVGVTHSSATRGRVTAGRGLCLRGAAAGCDARYAGVAADARFRLRARGPEVAGRVAIDFRRLSPAVVALEIGAVARWRKGRLAVTAEPYLSLGLVHSALDNPVAGNLPVALSWQVVPCVAVDVRTGFRGTLRDFLGTLEVPLGVGATFGLRGGVDVGASAGLTNAAGADGGAAARVAEVHVAWRPGAGAE
jgi:hypothetical protein